MSTALLVRLCNLFLIHNFFSFTLIFGNRNEPRIFRVVGGYNDSFNSHLAFCSNYFLMVHGSFSK